MPILSERSISIALVRWRALIYLFLLMVVLALMWLGRNPAPDAHGRAIPHATSRQAP